MDVRVAFMVAIKASIALMVFAIGLQTNAGDLSFLLRHRGLLFRSVLSMHVIMPVVALWLGFALRVPPFVMVTLAALAVSPVPPILPNKIVKSRGHAEYATSLLATVSLTSVFFAPASIALISTVLDIPFRIDAQHIAKLVLTSVLLPLLAGALVQRLVPTFAARIARAVSLIATVALLAALLPLLWKLIQAFPELMGDGAVISMVGITAIGLLVGHLLGGNDRADRTVLALSTSSRHPAIAIAIASAAFPEDKRIPVLVLLNLVIAAVVSAPYVVRSKAAVARSDGPPPRPMPSAPELDVPSQKAHYNSFRNRH